MYKEFKLVKNPSIIKAIEDLHANYIDRIVNYYRISDSDLNRFSWSEHKKVNIYMIKVFYDDDWKRDNYMTIAFAKKSTENKILIADCIQETKDPDFTRIPIASNQEQINWLISKKVLNQNVLNDIIISSLSCGIDLITSNPVTMRRWAKNWVEQEYKNTANAESNSTPVNYLSKINQRYFIDKYHFEDMLRIINNDQFTDELGQCMFAYENEKWFLCAAGLGSCLEHLMYMVLNNYDTKGYEDNNGRHLLSRFPKSPTARDYVTWFSKPPINIDARQKSAFNLYFMARNSVDHFNTGETQRIFCDVLLDGISETFNNYFQASVEAQPFTENNDN